MDGEDINEAWKCMSKLVNMALGQRIEPLVLTLMQSPWIPVNVDERPPPIVNMADGQHHAQLITTFFYGQSISVCSYIHDESSSHIRQAQ